MGAVVALETLLAARTVWHAGRSAVIGADGEATGHAALDELLPQGGWPRRALTELLLPADGVVADALEAVAVASRAWVLRFGPAGAWRVASRLSGGLLCNTSSLFPVAW